MSQKDTPFIVRHATEFFGVPLYLSYDIDFRKNFQVTYQYDSDLKQQI